MSIVTASTTQIKIQSAKPTTLLDNNRTFQNGRHFNIGSGEHLQTLVPPFRAATTTRGGRLGFGDITSTAFVRTSPYFLHSPFQAKLRSGLRNKAHSSAVSSRRRQMRCRQCYQIINPMIRFFTISALRFVHYISLHINFGRAPLNPIPTHTGILGSLLTNYQLQRLLTI